MTDIDEKKGENFAIPKTVFRRIVRDHVPDDKLVSRDAIELLQTHCEELATNIFERTNVVAGKNGRITIKKADFVDVVSELSFNETPVN